MKSVRPGLKENAVLFSEEKFTAGVPVFAVESRASHVKKLIPSLS